MAMKRSTSRILTTHTGSLPRPKDLVELMLASEAGTLRDRGALAERIHSATAEIVRRQIDAGIDVVNDGEVSKPSYSTYVKDRLNGFEGDSRSPFSQTRDEQVFEGANWTYFYRSCAGMDLIPTRKLARVRVSMPGGHRQRT